MELKCFLCQEDKPCSLRFNMSDYLKHIQLFHAHRPDFKITCRVNGCPRTFKNFDTFRKHILDWHSSDQNPTNNESEDSQPSLPDQNDDLTNYEEAGNGRIISDNAVQNEVSVSLKDLKTSSAMFLLSLKEERKLTQTAIQEVIRGVTIV